MANASYAHTLPISKSPPCNRLPPPPNLSPPPQVVVDALNGAVATCSRPEMMRESMRLVADAWALMWALGPLDDWTAAQARPAWKREVRPPHC